MHVRLLAVSVFICLTSANAAPADEALRALYTSEWAWRIDQFADDESNTHPVPARLPHVDSKTQVAQLAYWQATLAKLDKIPADQLSPKERINAQAYRFQLEKGPYPELE